MNISCIVDIDNHFYIVSNTIHLFSGLTCQSLDSFLCWTKVFLFRETICQLLFLFLVLPESSLESPYQCLHADKYTPCFSHYFWFNFDLISDIKVVALAYFLVLIVLNSFFYNFTCCDMYVCSKGSSFLEASQTWFLFLIQSAGLCFPIGEFGPLIFRVIKIFVLLYIVLLNSFFSFDYLSWHYFSAKNIWVCLFLSSGQSLTSIMHWNYIAIHI